jgi:hypothetical protein
MGEVQPLPGAGQHVGRLVLQPEQLQEREGRIGREAGQAVEPILADGPQQPLELRPGPLVIPGDDRRERPAPVVEGNQRLADAADRHADDALRPLDRGKRRPDRLAAGRPDRFRVVFGPAGAGARGRRRLAADRDGPSLRREQEGPDPRGAGVNAEQKGLVGCGHDGAGSGPPRAQVKRALAPSTVPSSWIR